MVATAAFEELHATWTVIFTVEPSVKLPCATKACDVPRLIAELLGVTVIEVKVAFVTVRL